jgi:AraC family transcriptional regulator, arabinose operon regulatory protein
MNAVQPQTSDWPLASGSVRVLMPAPLMAEMSKDKLSNACLPHAFGYYPSAHGHRMARQRPDDYLVIYCISGAAMVTIGANHYRVGAGELVLLPAAIPHSYAADEQDPWSIYWVHLNGDDLPRWFTRLDARHGTVRHLGLHDRLVMDFRSLLSLSSAGYSLAMGLHATSLSRSLLSYAWLLLQRQQHDSAEMDVGALHLFMQQHIHQRLTLEQLSAAASAPSRYQFIRQYKALTGQTPIQAFLHMKVSRACYLLEISDASVTDIAVEFGFDDAYYFSRLFKKVVGLSPAKYRQQGKA